MRCGNLPPLDPARAASPQQVREIGARIATSLETNAISGFTTALSPENARDIARLIRLGDTGCRAAERAWMAAARARADADRERAALRSWWRPALWLLALDVAVLLAAGPGAAP